ncbi:MAG TPA: hypothetical protein VK681_32850, partial [Reyranella sp.]|nr:hypothetical protein [Reyranella sp.]
MMSASCKDAAESLNRRSDLRLGREAEEQSLEETGSALAEPVAATRGVVEGAAMIALRHPHAGPQSKGYGLPVWYASLKAR